MLEITAASALAEAALMERLANAQLLLMDVDGVLTDGRLYNVPDPATGQMIETKGFDSQDGIALQWLNWHGIKAGLISGRTSPATEERARQCKFSYVYQGHIEKIPILEEIMADSKVELDQVVYIGDDLTDAIIMRRVGVGIATANARPEVKRIAHYITIAKGGSGAVREVIEMILKAKGLWEGILRKYEVIEERS
jgi:3-deoxy-D-manno-octulosonate 8-phosphate phosphatase (KDO 8-P phosphatase)